jgi:tetratricopeptide (TPR) repeat protein
MERLHVREGQANLARGIEATPNNVPQAARELTAALGHAEAALDANPSSLDATELGAEARRRLPDVLARLGQRQQAAGERAEAQSPAAAVPRYEEAEMSYRDALDLDSRQAQARTGLNEVEERLARLRAQMAQSAQAQQAQSQASNQRPRSLQDLLGEVRQNDRNRERESDRRRQPGRRDTSPRHVYPNW